MDALCGFHDVQENVAFFLLEKTQSLSGSFVGFLEKQTQVRLFGGAISYGKFSINGDSPNPQNKIIIFSKHSLQRMFDRRISIANVTNIVTEGTLIHTGADKNGKETHRNLGFVNGTPVHVVYSVDRNTQIKTLITVIIPEAKEWNADFTKLLPSRWNSATVRLPRK